MIDDLTEGEGPTLTMNDLRDIVAGLTANRDQREAALAEALGVERVSENAYLLASPDIGMRLTRDGVIPSWLKITWHLAPGTALLINPDEMRVALGPSSLADLDLP